MSDFDTTELKLKSTPTGGVDASHSPYYRRLLSSGYKGFLQGSIGGAALYGAFGLVIGGLVAAAAAPFVTVGAAGAGALWLLIPAAGGIGMLKGASTFGNIGSVAAINAESSDLSEQRRYLLDRYYDLPNSPEGDREAEAIKKELVARTADQAAPPHIFHWKTIAICGLVGAGLALAFLSPLGLGLMTSPATVTAFATKFGLGAWAANGVLSGGLMALGALAGGLTGATAGIDRYYIRKWFDHTEGVVHSSSHQDYGLMERHQQVARLQEAAKVDNKTKQHANSPEAIATAAINKASSSAASSIAAQKANVPTMDETNASAALVGSGMGATPPADTGSKAGTKTEKPGHTISAARREGLLEIHKAMQLSAG